MKEAIVELWGAIACGIVALFVLYFAGKKGFFQLPKIEVKYGPLRLWHVLIAFAIYFGVAILTGPLIIGFLQNIAPFGFNPKNGIALSTWANLLVSLLMAFSLILLCKCLPSLTNKTIWDRKTTPVAAKQDLGMGALAWVISFPLVLSVSQFLDVFVYEVFHVIQLPDQIAVAFLKRAFEQPFYFILSTFSIVVLAPFIEELIFRGFLQSYARQLLGVKGGIALSSLAFSFFHFSPEQGLGNIPIIGSLFVLALFLGFLYERQRSLLAPISLHACFNAISILNLYFTGGGACTLFTRLFLS